MRVMFVYSLEDVQSISRPLRSWAMIQPGISYISAVLKAHGHDTRLAVLGSDRSWRVTTRVLRSVIGDSEPHLVCLTAVSSQFSFIQRVAALLRRELPGAYLVVGGPHASINPDRALTPPFDALCRGEGEYPMVELCRQLEDKQTPSRIRNLWIVRRDGTVEKNESRPFLEDLDRLPFLDRSIWAPWIKEQADAELMVLASRGCPYDCTYCSNHALRTIAPGRYVRMRSPQSIIEETASLHEMDPARRRIYLETESIALNKAWLLELCRQLRAFNETIAGRLSYGCNFRISPQSADERLFAAMKEANFYKINIGIESGSERVRREVLNRCYSNKDVTDVVALARKYGLKVYTFNMIGLPGESLEDHLETVELNRQCQPDGHFTGIFFPYPGTELHRRCVELGLIRSPVSTLSERWRAVMDLPGFSKRQIEHAYTWFTYRVYRNHRPTWKLLIVTAMVKIRSHPVANYVFRRVVQAPLLSQLRAKLARA